MFYKPCELRNPNLSSKNLNTGLTFSSWVHIGEDLNPRPSGPYQKIHTYGCTGSAGAAALVRILADNKL